MRDRFAAICIISCAVLALAVSAFAESPWMPAKGLETPVDTSNCVWTRSVAADSSAVRMEYFMPQLQAVPVIDERTRMLLGAGYQSIYRLRLGNASNHGKIGEPNLPVVPAKIVVPAGFEVQSVDVQLGGKVSLKGSYTIAHTLQPYRKDMSLWVAPTPKNESVYGSDKVFPGKGFDVVGIQRQSGVPILFVNIYPVEYKPKSGKVSYYTDVCVSVKLTPIAGAMDAEGNEPKVLPDPVCPLELNTDNPEALAGYYQSASVTAASLPVGVYQYVIVTTDAIKNSTVSPNLNDLLTWKKQKGYSGTIQTMEYIKSNYSGYDDAEKLRNFIKDAYNAWGTRWVLLAGDMNIVPMRKFWTDDDGIPTDLYYGCLDGTMDYNNNHVYGEFYDGVSGGAIDMLYEVYVGRASFENTTEMSNFVYKTLAYEKEVNSNRFKNVLLVGDNLGDGWLGSVSQETLRLGSDVDGYHSTGFVENVAGACTYSTLYETDTTSYSTADIVGRMNSNNFGIVTHDGHGGTEGTEHMGLLDIDGLTNNKFFFNSSQACYPGNFEGDCFAEHMSNSRRTGAFGTRMNTRYGWGGGSEPMERQFYHNWNAGATHNIGAMEAVSDAHFAYLAPDDYYFRYEVYETTVLADPEARLRGSAIAYTVTANPGTGGTIAPGTVPAESGETRVCSILPNPGYSISSVTVDGVNQGAISAYTFSNITANHNIAATFTSSATRYTVSGKVSNSAGTGLAGTTVYISSVSGAYANGQWTTTTDSSGNYSYSLPNGTWYLAANCSPDYACSADKTVTINGANLTGQNFTLADQPIPTPLVKLDVSSLKTGNLTTWANTGSLGGSFGRVGSAPSVGTVGGKKCVTFNGSTKMLATFAPPTGISGGSDWTVAIWAYNPSLAVEECMLSWGPRGMWDGQNAQINFGSSPDWGAVAHWGSRDMGYDGGVPSANAWHHICVEYDSSTDTEKVYVDGVLNAQEYKDLFIWGGLRMYLGCAYDWDGGTVFTPTLGYSGSVGTVKIYDTALTQSQIINLKNQTW